MAEESRLVIAIDSRGAETNARAVRRELEGMERAGSTATRAARSTAGGFGRIARSSQLAVPPVSNLTALLGGLSGVIGARQIINYSDAWQNAGNQLRQVTDSADELAGTQERLLSVANSTRADFGSTANLYSRLARSTTELGLSQSDLIGLTRTINQSFATSGATAEEASAAITQLSQGLAAGALRGDEFNSVSEQAPGIMRAIAESLDMTIGELRDFAAEGGITSEIVVTALQESADAIENDFGRAVATFGQDMTVARNNLIAFVGGAESVEGGIANIGDVIVGLSENLDDVATAATVVAGVFGGRLAGRFITVAAGMTSAAGAATALRTALAFLGGPAGIAVTAATALFAFREELGLISTPAKDAREEVELLTGALDGLNSSSIDAAMVAINAQMFELEMRSRDVRQELEELENSGSGALGMSAGATGQQARLLAEQGQIGTEQGALSEQMERLRALGSGLDRTTDAASRTADTLMDTREQAGELKDTAKDTSDAFDDGRGAVQDFSRAASDGARAIASATGGGFGRGAIGAMEGEQDNGLRSVRQNIEAGKDLSAYWLEPNPSARNTWSTEAYDAAGSAIPRSPSAADSPAGTSKPMGSFTIRVQKEGEGDTEGTVQGDDEFIKRMASALGGVATAV